MYIYTCICTQYMFMVSVENKRLFMWSTEGHNNVTFHTRTMRGRFEQACVH